MASAVQAPFNTSPAYSGTFIPQIWSGKLNAKFYTATVFNEIANTEYQGDISDIGDKVIINNIPSIAIRDYTIGQSLQYEVPTPDTVELDIDKGKYFGFSVSDVLEHQANPDLMNTFTDDASEQMAITVDADVLDGVFDQGAAANKGATAGVVSGKYNLGTDASPVTLSATTVVPLLTALASTLDEQSVPESDRCLVIPPFARNWLMQSNLAQAYVTNDSQSILRSGFIGTIDRFKVYVSNQLPSANANEDYDGNTNSSVARSALIACHKTAITFASQITKVENLPNPTDFGTLVRGLNVYGYKVIKPEALALAQIA